MAINISILFHCNLNTNHCNVYFEVTDIFIVTLLLVDHRNAYMTSSIFIKHWSHLDVDNSARASDVRVQYSSDDAVYSSFVNKQPLWLLNTTHGKN